MKDNADFLSRIADTLKMADKNMTEVPKALRVISAVTAGALFGSACEPAVKTLVNPGTTPKPGETAPLPTEQSKVFFGELKSANTDILNDFWSNTVIPNGVTKNEVRCLDVSVPQKDFYFCAYNSKGGQQENWSMKVEDKVKGTSSWRDLTKVIKQGYNMEGQIIDVATWTLDSENVIWYPEYQADWLKDSQNPNFGINFMPPSAFGKDVIPGYDRTQGLGIRLPLKNTSVNDPYSPENIFANIAYRTGYQVGGPTETQEPTPTPEATATTEPTPTPEVKQFPICQIEQFRDCPITVDDLFNGEYHRWLKTLSKPFDPAKLKWVPMEEISYPNGRIIVYDTKTAPNYRDESIAPFRRSVTSGVTTYQGMDYLIIPIEYADPKDPGNPEKNVWVIGVQPLFTKAYGQNAPYGWKNDMHIAPIVTSDGYWADGSPVPLVTKSFEENPKMAEYFQSFLAGNVSALDGKVVQLALGKDTAHLFE